VSGVLLHARCRAIPSTLLLLLAVGLVTWAAYQADSPRITHEVGRAAVLLGAAATARTFAGPDADLERAAAVPWWLVRVAQLVLLAAVSWGVVVAARHIGQPADTVAHGLLVRQAVGFVSLTALGAVLFGARTAWVLAVAWGLIAMSTGPQPSVLGEMLNWMFQDPATTASTATFTALTAGGAGAYIRRGSRPSPS
jgi:hypothetical protein